MSSLLLPLLKGFSYLMAALPDPVISLFSKVLARAAYLMDGRHRKVVAENLERAFGESMGPEKRRDTALKVFENIAMNALEFMRIPWLSAGDLNGYVELTGLENFERAISRGRGVIFYTAHFGNWELLAAALGLAVHPMDIVVRELDSPLVEDFITWARTRSGNSIVYKKRSMRKLLRTLSDNGVVGILLDQNVTRSEGVFVDFFGTPACTNKGPALLAIASGAAVLPVFIVREGKRHRIVIGGETGLSNTGDREKDVVVNTQRFTSVIEEMIREHPEQWFWVHRRWKTRPPSQKGT